MANIKQKYHDNAEECRCAVPTQTEINIETKKMKLPRINITVQHEDPSQRFGTSRSSQAGTVFLVEVFRHYLFHGKRGGINRE